MKCLILYVMLLEIILSGSALPDDIPADRRQPRCKKPPGKPGQTLVKSCTDKEVCTLDAKNKAKWHTCPITASGEDLAALDSKLNDVDSKIEDVKVDLEELNKQHIEIIRLLHDIKGPTTLLPSTMVTPAGCPSGWSLYESSCYRFYSASIGWTQAQEECQKEKSNLASVTNVGIKTFIGGLQKDNNAFIGGSKPASSNPKIGWEWLDNTPWSYTNWRTNEPSHTHELCIAQLGIQGNGWNNVVCSYSGYDGYVCEKLLEIKPEQSPASTTTATTTTATALPSCPSRWSLYESSCYRFYSTKLSWTQAKEECQKENSNLASVTNVGIKTFIGGLQKDKTAFVGGSRPAGSNPNLGWEWLDNSAWSYQNWQTGEPNNANNNEFCVEQLGSAYGNKWYDSKCSSGWGPPGYVCEKHWTA